MLLFMQLYKNLKIYNLRYHLVRKTSLMKIILPQNKWSISSKHQITGKEQLKLKNLWSRTAA